MTHANWISNLVLRVVHIYGRYQQFRSRNQLWTDTMKRTITIGVRNRLCGYQWLADRCWSNSYSHFTRVLSTWCPRDLLSLYEIHAQQTQIKSILLFFTVKRDDSNRRQTCLLSVHITAPVTAIGAIWWSKETTWLWSTIILNSVGSGKLNWLVYGYPTDSSRSSSLNLPLPFSTQLVCITGAL